MPKEKIKTEHEVVGPLMTQLHEVVMLSSAQWEVLRLILGKAFLEGKLAQSQITIAQMPK